MNNITEITLIDNDRDSATFRRSGSEGDLLIRASGDGGVGTLVLLKKVQVDFLIKFIQEDKEQQVTMDRDGVIRQTNADDEE